LLGQLDNRFRRILHDEPPVVGVQTVPILPEVHFP
jgi:hypothetical protein